VSQISYITIQLDAEFHELQGRRNVITILTGGEKDPMVMGFKLMDDSPERFPVQPEGDLPQDDDGQDVDIDVAEMQAEGQEIPVGQIIVRADPDDEITVNGTKPKPTSTLAALRAGCAFYNLSSSGSKVKCFQRIAEYQKRLELEMVMAAAKDSQKELEREPHAPPTAEPPSELEQAKHRLTHLPYSNWCPSCLMHRAHRHERTGESHEGSIPTISFDFFYTKADGLAFGRQYKGDLCEYGELVYGYVNPGTNKAAARWRRALFRGKTDSQNSFLLLMDSPLFFPRQEHSKNQHDLEEPSCILPSLQVLLMAIQIRFWCQDFAYHEKGHSSICKFRSAIGAD